MVEQAVGPTVVVQVAAAPIVAVQVEQVVGPTAAEVEQKSEPKPHHNCSKRLHRDCSEHHTADRS